MGHMPLLTIAVPSRYLRKIKTQARREGFKNPTEWVRFMIERNVGFEESPRLRPAKIISEMESTGLYRHGFLRDLKRSLEYADRTA